MPQRRSGLIRPFRPLLTDLVGGVLAGAIAVGSASGQEVPKSGDAAFAQDVHPLVETYCVKCHSTEKQKGDLDLEQFKTLADVLKSPDAWQRVVEQIELGEMPPKDKPQPTSNERLRLVEGVDTLLNEAALARAGDPGPVVLRRLNNAEYTFTIRDLTGVDSLDPAKEFPADSASGEGFMNVGNSLVMSPSLVTKYLDAAKEIAAHAVLLPDGIRFSPSTFRRDWTEELLAEIRGLYFAYTDNGGGTSVNLQGIRFDTKDGGVLPLDRYLAVLLEERVGGTTNFQNYAGLSEKYLVVLRDTLDGEEPNFLLDPIRARWREAKPDDAEELAAEIAQWQHALWRFNSVGHIGKRDGPIAWMEPLTPLVSKQEFRSPLPAANESNDVVLYLVASDAGDGHQDDQVIWEQPRFEAANRPTLLLSDLQPPGIGPDRFDDRRNLLAHAPAVIEVRLPAEQVAGYEFVTTARLDPRAGTEGSVQFLVSTNKPVVGTGLIDVGAKTSDGEGPWYSNNRVTSNRSPIVANQGSAKWTQIEADFEAFRQIFPAALCYTKIVPVDEVVTLTLFYREDDHFKRLMLDDEQAARLDRLWDELRYVSQDALKLVDVFEQLWQYATQDADPGVFEPMREPIQQNAVAFRQRLLDTEPAQVNAVLAIANDAFRRPLTVDEQDELRRLYRQLRDEELSHDDAVRLMIARVLVSPAFLYRLEEPPPGDQPGPVDNWELATRLSYFLWSSMPDAELRAVAATGELGEPNVLAAQTRRMLRDPKVRRLATEFGCAWLHVHGFDELDEKSPRHFPTFAGLRDAMYEETILFFTDLFQQDASVLNLIDADYTFLNEELAMHYGIPFEGIGSSRREEALTKSEVQADQSLVTSSTTNKNVGWRKVEGVKQYGRGGILGLGATLAKQSGASRTSPILRGNWVAEVLLGDKLPRPPKDVPQLPEDEATEALTVRELTEKHSTDPKCYGCHRRIDGYGFALEAYDAIGRLRAEDLGGRPIETRTTVFDGTEIADARGLRDYLLTAKRDTVLRQFNRKLLGYALGRSVMLSDRPLLDEMQHQLEMNDYRISAAIETIVRSRQFREIRGRDMFVAQSTIIER